MKRRTFLVDLISKTLRGEKMSMDELEITNVARKIVLDSNLPFWGYGRGFALPISLNDDNDDFLSYGRKRALETQLYMVQDEQRYLINPITEKSVFAAAGALFLEGQNKNFKVPSMSGILAQNLEPDAEPVSDGTTITVGGASFAPKRFYILLDVPVTIIQRGGPEVEKWLSDNITAALAAKVDAVIGGILISDTTRPQGMGYAITTGATTQRNAIAPTYNDIVALEESVGSNFGGINIPGASPAYITNSAGRRILRKVYSGDSNTEPVWKDGKVLDVPAYCSDLIANNAGADGLGNLLLYGNWKDLCVVQFGAYDIIVDHVTLKKAGKIQLCVNAYFDFKGLRTPVSTGEATEANEYASSFGALAIK